jgi:hypothetical protein
LVFYARRAIPLTSSEDLASEELTSDGLVGLKSTVQEAFAEFAELRREVSAAWQELNKKQERSKKPQGNFFARVFRKKAIAAASADAEDFDLVAP